MALFRNIVIFFMIMVTGFLGCSDEEDKDTIKLLVFSGGTFQGSYIYNGTTFLDFGRDSEYNPYIQSGSTYRFEVLLEDLEQLSVTVTRDDQTDSIRIIIYREEIEVKDAMLDANLSSSTNVSNTLLFEYEYGEETGTSTDDTTTTADDDDSS